MPISYDAPIEIRDNRNGSWFWVHTHVWRDKRLTLADKAVYSTIASYSNTEQTSFPSVTKIAHDTNISERHCYRSIKNLEKYDYLFVDRKGRQGKPSIYTLVKTTPDMKSPLTGSHTTPDIKTVPTPDIKTVLTITNITRTNNKNIHEDKLRDPLTKRNFSEKQQLYQNICIYLEEKLQTKFTNYPKQMKAIKQMFSSGYTEKQIYYVINQMLKEDFYRDKGFDLTTVMNQIPLYKAKARKARENVSTEIN